MIINIILVLVVIIGAFNYCYKKYKNCKGDLESALYIMLFTSIFIPTCIYYLDRYNIPSLLNWNKNINTQNWLSFFATYSSSIINAFIGAVFLILITKIQIIRNNEYTYRKDKEERRINNLPLLQYEFNSEKNCRNFVTIDTKFNEKKDSFNKQIILSVKNIGINAVKKCYVSINNEYLLHDYTFPISSQSCIDKGEQKSIIFIFKFIKTETVFKYKIYYQDLLSNWYIQNIEMHYICDKNDSINDVYKLNISEEKILKKVPNLKLSI